MTRHFRHRSRPLPACPAGTEDLNEHPSRPQVLPSRDHRSRGPATVLYVNHTARMGGAEHSLLDLVRGLDRSRFRPVAAMPEGPLQDALGELSVSTLSLPLQRFHRTRNPLRLAEYAASLLTVGRRLQHTIRSQGVDIVHANSNAAQLYAARAARRTATPCIWHTRDLVDLGRLAPHMARHATAIIAISHCVATHLRPQVTTPITTIHNGLPSIHHSPLTTHSPPPTIHHPPFTIHPLIAMAGQLVPWKNHPLFIEAAARMAARLPNARFLIIGDDRFGDHPGYRSELESLARARGLQDRLTFTGHRKDITAVLNSIDILVHPADREPFGRVVAEAMALAKPVVAINACGPAEIIRPDIDGLLVPLHDPTALANAVCDLAQDPAKREQLGHSAQARIANAFPIESTVKRIMDLYDKLLE